MPLSSVVVPAVVRHPLDALGVAVYVAAFALVGIATYRRAAFAPAALVVLAPFAFYRDVGHTTVTLSKVALVAAACALAARRTDLRALASPALRPLLAASAAVVALTGITVFWAAHPEPVVRETLKAFEYLVLFGVVVAAASADPDETPVRVALGATLVAVAGLACAQEVTGAPSGLWFANFPVPRVAGPLEGPNQLAAYLGLALAAVAAFALARAPWRLERAALLLGSLALVLTLSRAGLLAGALGLAVVFARSPRERRRGALLLLAGGALLGALVVVGWGYAATHSLLGTDLLARFSSLAEAERAGGVGKRSDLWHAAVALWRAHPWTGVGAGNFELEIGLVGPHGVRTHANSLYLQALAEGGIPLLLATLALVAASIATFARTRDRTPLVVGALGASAGLAAHQLVDFLTFYPKVGELWWVLLGLGAARLARAQPRTARAARPAAIAQA